MHASRRLCLRSLSRATRALPLLALFLLPTTSRAQTAPFAQLDDVEAGYTNLGIYPIRPMAFDSSTFELFTVNVGMSTVLRFTQQNLFGGPAPQPWQVPANPVSIGIWQEPQSGGGTLRRLVVVCRGDHAAV